MFTLTVILQLFLLLGVFSDFSLSTATTSTTPRPVSKQDACNFWRDFSSEMNNFNRIYRQISYNCSYDPDKCTGADCTGAIRFELPGIRMVHVNFCFGLRINHCDHPNISVDIYYTNNTNNFAQRIYHNDRKELSSLSMQTSLGDITPFVFFNLTKPEPHHVLFGAKVKVRVRSKLFGIESWPSDYQQDIIPNTEIPVTPCTGSATVAPPLAPKKCIAHQFPTTLPATTPSYPVVTKSTNQNTKFTTTIRPTTTINISPTFNKSCDTTSLQSCGVNEMCVASKKDQNKGICKCIPPEQPIDRRTGLCPGSKTGTTAGWHIGSTTMKTIIGPQPHKDDQGSQSKSISKSAMIGGIVGGVVFLVVILVVVVFMCRRNRSNSQYVGRLLLDNDDSDNVI